MKKLNMMQIISLSMMLFAFFFGAGNMIFPPAMGQLAGSHFPSAVAGFILTDVGIAILGVTSIVLIGKNIDDIGKLVSKPFALCFSILIYLLVGPLFALPRTATVSFEISFLPYIDPKLEPVCILIFSAIFFGLTYYMSSNSKKLVDLVGTLLTPFLLLSIVIIFVFALMRPEGNGTLAFGQMMPPAGDYQHISFFKGMIEGYNALDGPAGLAFAIIIINSIRHYGVEDKHSIAKYAIICGFGSALFLSVVYYMLAYIGAVTNQPFSNGGALLHAVTNHLLGSTGGIVLGIAVLLACLATAIGLASSFSGYFLTILPKNKNWTYKKIAAIVCFISFIIANVGLDHLIQISLPVFIIIYPVTIVLIVLSFFRKRIGHRRMVYVLGMVFTFVLSLIDSLESANIDLGIISDLVAKIPLYKIGFGWIICAVIGSLLGLLPIWPMNKVKE